MRFNLLRYYSIASAVAVVAVTAILVIFYGRYATDSLVASIEKQNVILASFVAMT
jgi:anti-sigma-K factor RskA